METTEAALDHLLNEHHVARLTGLSISTIRRWRAAKEGPRYLKIGAAVRYKREDVARWIDSVPTGGGNAG